MNPVAQLWHTTDGELKYESLHFVCPGCKEWDFADGLHSLPVIGETGPRPRWDWNGDLVKVTLTPSILTDYGTREPSLICHSFLTDGVFNFLTDSTHSLAGQQVPMPPLEDWMLQH